MARINLDIDRELLNELTKHGLDLERICTTALEAEYVRVQAETSFADDATLYQRGFEAGATWAAERANQMELAEIVQWSTIRWQQFSVIPYKNSFAYAYCEGVRLAYPPRDKQFHFSSDAFTRGMVDGAAAVATAT